MADRGHLTGLGLAAVERTAEPPRRRTADGLHRVPEVGGGGLVGHIADLAVEFAAADAEEALAGELEVVALHVDRPALVPDDVDAVVHPGDQVGGAQIPLPGLQ